VEAAFGWIGCTQIKQAAAAGPIAGKRLRQAVGGEVPFGARGEHAICVIAGSQGGVARSARVNETGSGPKIER